MKHILYTAALLICCMGTSLFTMGQSKIGKAYKIKVNMSLFACDISGDTSGFNPVQLPSGSKFTVVNQTATGDLVIKFWQWGTENDLNTIAALNPGPSTKKSNTIPSIPSSSVTNQQKIQAYNYYYENSRWHTRYFIMTSGNIDIFCDEVVRGWNASAGAVTMPFKYRPDSRSFDKDVSLSGMGGVSFSFNSNFKMSGLIGIGLSDVTINETNTDGRISESSNVSALTLSTGLVFQYKAVQAGLFIGCDNLSDSNKDNWESHGNLWFGAGIGISIYSESTKAEEGKNK
jgi:hypothetical protein